MSVILPGDGSYRRAKRARQGKARLHKRYDGFVNRFRERYGSEPLWLETDNVTRPGAAFPWPRLEVVLERTKQHRPFVSGFGYDATKQRDVAGLFAGTLPDEDLWPLFRIPHHPRGNLPAKEIFVCFSDFERVAKTEAHAAVTADELARFTSSLGLQVDVFWCVQRASGPPTVFVHTDEQAAALKSSPLRDRWADEYFELVRAHDEFGYLDRAEIAVTVDSRQNFEENFSGNWYHYFK